MRKHPANLTHYKLSTFDMGKLVPTALWEVLPNDTFVADSSLMLRLSPMVAPVMHGMTMRVHYWWVPNRIVWEGWEDFITGGSDGITPEDMTFRAPSCLITTRSKGDLLDHFGVPPKTMSWAINYLPLAGYYTIWNEFYRDQDLVDAVDLEALMANADANNEISIDAVTLKTIAWGKDYFTTARPWPLKGDEVTIPVDVDQIHVSDIRTASAVTRLQERRARYGSRYLEYIRAEFGINPRPASVDLPEYLGGGQSRVSISEVLQTAPETGQTGVDQATEYGVGDLYGHGMGTVRTRPWKRTFTEHGFVMCLVSVRPDSIYVDAINRHWSKQTMLDYFQKDAQYLGQQQVLKGEIAYTGAAADGQVFGYSDRYREYRELQSGVSGDFRDLLKYWHFGRDIANPVLNGNFVQCNVSKRPFAVQSHDVCWAMMQHRIRGARVVGPSVAGRIV